MKSAILLELINTNYGNETERLAEVMDKMNTRPLGRQINKTDLVSIIFKETEEVVAEIIQVMTEVEKVETKVIC